MNPVHLIGKWIAFLLALSGPCLADDGKSKAQSRPHGQRVAVSTSAISVDDGDTIVIRWDNQDVETVRILGIDAPEIQHVEHDIPFDQAFGREAHAFAKGVLAMADKVELLRASMIDPYGRTLGYVFINGKNYSVLALQQRMAIETVSVYGDNGLPEEAAKCTAAAHAAGKVAFEPPYLYRRRMRDVAQEMRSQGLLPEKKPAEPTKAAESK